MNQTEAEATKVLEELRQLISEVITSEGLMMAEPQLPTTQDEIKTMKLCINLIKAVKLQQETIAKLNEYTALLIESMEAVGRIFDCEISSAESKLLKRRLAHIHPVLNKFSPQALKRALIRADVEIFHTCLDLGLYGSVEADKMRKQLWEEDFTWDLVHVTLPELSSLKKRLIRYTRRLREDMTDPGLMTLSMI